MFKVPRKIPSYSNLNGARADYEPFQHFNSKLLLNTGLEIVNTANAQVDTKTTFTMFNQPPTPSSSLPPVAPVTSGQSLRDLFDADPAPSLSRTSSVQIPTFGRPSIQQITSNYPEYLRPKNPHESAVPGLKSSSMVTLNNSTYSASTWPSLAPRLSNKVTRSETDLKIEAKGFMFDHDTKTDIKMVGNVLELIDSTTSDIQRTYFLI